MKKYLIPFVAIVFVISGCGGSDGGGETSTASDDPVPLSNSQAAAVVSGYLSNSQTNIIVNVGFSPVQERQCDVYGQLSSNNKYVCIVIDSDEEIGQSPTQSLGENVVHYFKSIPGGETEAAIRSIMVSLANADYQPVILSDVGDMFLGFYTKSGVTTAVEKICAADVDNASLTARVRLVGHNLVSIRIETLELENDGDGCFYLPGNITALPLGRYIVENLVITNSSAQIVAIPELIGSFKINNDDVPDIMFSSVPSELDQASSATFEYFLNQSADVFASLDDGAEFEIPLPYTTHELKNGYHTLKLWAINELGLRSNTLWYTWMVDVPPSIDISSAPPVITNKDDVKFKFVSDSGGVNFEASVNGGEYAAVSNPLMLASLTEGSHTLSVRAISTTGKVSEIKQHDWIVDLSAPSAQVVFPTRRSLIEGSYITVRGTASDNTGVKGVLVNGLPALSGDNYLNWSVVVPLVVGENPIVVLVEDVDGNVNAVADHIIIEREDNMLARPVAIAQHAMNGEIYVLDYSLNALIKIDPVTGQKTVVSDNSDGLLPKFSWLQDIAIDSENDVAYITDFHLKGVMAVNLTSGARTEITGMHVGSGPDFSIVDSIVIDELNDRLLVSDPHLKGIMSVSLDTGNRAVLGGDGWDDSLSQVNGLALNTGTKKIYMGSSGSPGSLFELDIETGLTVRYTSPSFGFGSEVRLGMNQAMCVDPLNNRLLVLDDKNNGLVSIDLSTRKISQVGFGVKGGKVKVAGFTDLTCNDNGEVILADQDRAHIVRLDLITELSSLVSGGYVGSGAGLDGVQGLDVDLDAGVIVVTGNDSFSGSMISIDLFSGDRTEISNSAGEYPTEFWSVGDVQIDSANNSAYVVNRVSSTPSSIYSIDFLTGERTEVSGRYVGSGDLFTDGIRGMVKGSSSDVAYAVSGGRNGHVWRIDLSTGNRSVMSGNTTGSGVDYRYGSSIELDEASNRLLVGGLHDLYSVDIESGNRFKLWSSPEWGYVTSVQYDEVSDRVLTGVREAGELYWVNVENGEYQLVVSKSHGSGVTVLKPGKLSYNPDNQTAFMLDSGRGAVLMVDLISGERVISSR